MDKQWYAIKAAAAGAEIYIYGDIGDFGISASAFVDELKAVEAKSITVRINSPGGSVSDGVAIYNALKRHPAKVTTAIDGMALSIASLIACAGDTVTAAENAVLMLHAPWIAGMSGNAADLRKAAEALDATQSAMVTAYARKTGQTDEQILAVLAAETWYTAAEALDFGLVDEITDPIKVAAHFDFTRFRNAPQELLMDKQQPNGSHDTKEFQAAEQNRRTEIRALFQPFNSREGMRDFMDGLLDDMTVSVEIARERLLTKLGEGSEPLATAPRVTYGENHHHDNFRAAVVDALLIRNGVSVTNPHPAVQDIRGMALPEIAGTLLRQKGRTTDRMSRADVIQAAMTTSDFPALMENVANKAVLTGFREAESATHRQWTRAGNLPDFKQARRVALSEAPDLLPKYESGEIQYGSLTDAKESIQLSTYARIIGISREALINDDLGELTRVPAAMGQAAARKETDIAYSVVTSNPTMRDGAALFHASHNNLAGTPAVLSATSLGEARTAMRKQKGVADAAYLNIVPSFLLIPPELETEAEQLLATLAPFQASDAVPAWIRNLTVVAEPRLSDNSTTAWYLVANPNQHDTVEVAKLDSDQWVTRSDEDFDTADMRFRIIVDVGAAALDWRGMFKNAGA